MDVIIIMTIVVLLVIPFLGWSIIASKGKNAPTTLHTSPLPLEIGAVQPLQEEEARDTSPFCHRCQAPLRPRDLFCSQCGHRCREKASQLFAKNQGINSALEGKICTFCHTFLLPQDQFCGVCGNQTRPDTEKTYT